uniref:FZ domain-containing protein n=1 Tax=Clastoptera arizonana TaxID=38151 RepID=A0A1B6CT02_9HEMI
MRKYTSKLFNTPCANSMYKVENGKVNYDSILTWKVLRWAIIPAAVLMGVAMLVYFIIDDSNVRLPQEALFQYNQNQDFDTDNNIISLDVSSITYQMSNTESASPDTKAIKSPSNTFTTEILGIEQEKEVLLPDQTETPYSSEESEDIVTSESKPATLSNRLRISTMKPNFKIISTTQQSTGIKGSISFVDKLLTNFDTSKTTEKVIDDMDEFLKEEEKRNYPQDKTIFYRRPNGHKYGEYQAPPAMNRHGISTMPPPVSPTLPPSRTTEYEVTETKDNDNENDTLCQSPSLYMCQGMLPWDLTAKAIVPGVTSEKQLYEVLPYLQVLAGIGCSPRARQFLCSLLEPECRSVGYSTLPPCRKSCKAVAEECADIIVEEDIMSSIFDCDIYPDLDNPEECVNLASGPQCYGNEFRCLDGTCIPQRWVCNGVRDCSSGADELNCSNFTCSEDKFRCKSDSKCIPVQWKCDTKVDCEDGSDELNCPKPVSSRDSHQNNNCPKGLLSLRCVDGRCITFDQICDNVTDCSDGSDESSCFP